MAKRNWFETISDRVPAEREYEVSVPEKRESIFGTWPAGSLFLPEINSVFGKHFTPIKDLMEEFERSGFQDKGDSYELVTNLGGFDTAKANVDPEKEIKIEIDENCDCVHITYSHSNNEKNNYCMHQQRTVVSLPEDADKETLNAFFDDDNNIVLTVNKIKKVEPRKGARTIPIRTK